MERGETGRQSRQLVTVKQAASLPQYSGAFTEQALRHLIFNAEDKVSSRGEVLAGNRLNEFGAIIRIGRRVLLDLDRFDAWIDHHRLPHM